MTKNPNNEVIYVGFFLIIIGILFFNAWIALIGLMFIAFSE